MKEQSAYASQEQNPFMSSVIFNFQQLYQHLQFALPKSHMTCFQPTIDKAIWCFPERQILLQTIDLDKAVESVVVGVTVRNKATAPDWTTHLLFSQRS